MLPLASYLNGTTPGQQQLAIGMNSSNPDAPGVAPPAPSIGGNMPPPLPTSFGGGSTGGSPAPAPAPVPAPIPATGGVPTPTPTPTPLPATGGTTPAPVTPTATPIDYNAAFDNFKNFIGYDFALKQAMDALNNQYAAHGQLQSGAAAKGIADYATQMAQQGAAFPYLNYLSGQQNMGATAASSIAGIGSNYGNSAANLGQNYGNAVTGINAGMGGAIQNGANGTANGAILGGLANAGMYNNIGSALGNLGSSIFAPSTGTTGSIGLSDRRLKTNIVKIGEDADGLGRYEWNWKADPNGERVRGVIADEVKALRPWAYVENFRNGYDGVNYATLEARNV
jgi:hypothetical protein